MNKTETLDKIKLLQLALQRPTSWYTGNSVKKFLSDYLFNLKPGGFHNSAIKSGRWSAYVHYSEIQAFENLLDKNHIKHGSKLLVHPLLPAFLVDKLIQRGVEISTFDINKDTLQADNNKFIQLLSRQATPPDLVLFYGFNGLYEELAWQISSLQTSVVPSLVVIDNPDLNLSLLNLFQVQTLGGVLWCLGDSFLDDELNFVLDQPLKTKNWYASWQIEDRTRSIPEYHLQQSFDSFYPLLESYLYLLEQQNNAGGVIQTLKTQISSLSFAKPKFANQAEAVEILKNNYAQAIHLAVPDWVFDLHRSDAKPIFQASNSSELVSFSNRLAAEAKNLDARINSQIPNRPQNSTQPQKLDFTRSHLKYFLYTTEQAFWYQQLKIRYQVELFPKLHPKFESEQNLEMTKFIQQFGLIIDIPSALKLI